MSKPDLMVLAQEERADLLELTLEELNAEQWNAQSLCTEWRVREVATHIVSYDELSVPRLVGTFVRGGLRGGGVNDVALERYQDLKPAAIIELVSHNLRPAVSHRASGVGLR